ncbi:MAG: hypothetical protein ACJAUV_002412 [Flavobacteriales bacterium]|jgi:hypothetical protein
MKNKSIKHYPIKVLFSWGLAIKGDIKFRDWLIKNGYKELGLFVYGLHLKDEAREWLLKNAPHLMALLNAVEENPQALKWLKINKYDALFHVAEAALEKQESIQWLNNMKLKELLFVAQQIGVVKNQIATEHNETYKISRE